MKKTALIPIILSLALAGCAKSATMKYAEPEARALCEENFYERYHVLVTNDEKNELQKIKTISDCEIFINSFWDKRDINPLTPENEFKDEMEKRLQFIQEEMLFQNVDTPGVRFENNGGLWGDLAKVYMLHGTPDYMEVLQNGRSFVDLMIWVYLDESGQRHKFRFLFYHKNGIASFVLFRPLFDITLGLQEISKNSPFINLFQVYDEIEQRMGYIFLLSLVYFSDDLSLNLDETLDPPKTASEIIKNEAPTIQGETPQQGEEIVYKNEFNATIPAELSHKSTEDSLVIKITVKLENLDWKISNGELTAEIYARAIVQDGNETMLEEKTFYVISSKEKILEKTTSFVFEIQVKKPKSVSTRYSVYIKNNNKYNAWLNIIELAH